MQEQCDESIETLVDGLSGILPYVEIVKQAAKLPRLRENMTTLVYLIEDASRFVSQYNQDGNAVQTLKTAVGLDAQAQVDDMLKKLRVLIEEFDRGVNVQTLQTLEQTRQAADVSAYRALLKKLHPVGRAQYDSSRACMPGTREDIINNILDWSRHRRSNSSLDKSEGLLWVYGHAGIGKSAIATSVCEKLDDQGLLAASFFCKRDDPERRNPQKILTSIIHSLSVHHPAYAHEVATQLQLDISLCDSPMQKQYDRLIRDALRPLAHTSSDTCLVIVIDAIDECGTPDTRSQLLGYLQRMQQYTTWLRIIVTSRPDKDIERTFGEYTAASMPTQDVYRYDASGDILAFVKQRISRSRKGPLLPPRAAEALAEGAGGLFIWAETACHFVLASHDPCERLTAILEGSRDAAPSIALDELYTTAINASMEDTGEDNARLVQECLGAIIACSTRTPLSVVTLSALLGEQAKAGVMQSVVDSLGSVLYTDYSQGGAVRVYHPSFADYMTTPARSGKYCVDVQQQNTVLAAGCMKVLDVELKFNICGLETSYKRNRDIPDLSSRIEQSVSQRLEYSCLYWTNHLVGATSTPDTLSSGTLLCKLVTGPCILYWFEVLSLLGKLHTALTSIADLKLWCEGSTLQENIDDIARFIQCFYDPISESAPHLYLSGLGFLPTTSAMAKLREKWFMRTPTIIWGRENTWPAWLRCISHDGPASCLAVSTDGRRIVTGSMDNKVQLWDVETGTAYGSPLVGHSGAIWSVAFSPDGRRIVSGSRDCTVRLWSTSAGMSHGEPLRGHSRDVRSVIFFPDGRRILSGSEDGTIRVWDADTGLAVGSPLVKISSRIYCVAISPDGLRVASGSLNGGVRVWNASTGAVSGDPLISSPDDIQSIAFSPDGHHIVSGSYDNSIRLWDAFTGAPVGDPITGHSNAVLSVAFSPDSRHIISGSRDKSVQIWDAITGIPIKGPLIGHSDFVSSVVFSPDGRRIISSSWDKTVRIWDLNINASTDDSHTEFSDSETHAENTSASLPAGHLLSVCSVAFSPDNKNIVSGSDDGTVRVWDAHTGVAIGNPFFGHSGFVTSVSFSPDGRIIASGSYDNTLRLWDTAGTSIGDPLVGHSLAVCSVAFSPDGRQIVSGSHDKMVRVWDIATGDSVGDPIVGHTDYVTSVMFSPDGRFIVSGSYDNTVRLWDASTRSLVGSPLVGHSDSVEAVTFSSSGRLIASGSSDETVRIWDVGTGLSVGDPLVGHDGAVFSLTFSPDDCYIVSASGDYTLRIWNLDTGAPIGEPLLGHSDGVSSVAFSPNGRHIASGSQDSTIRLWDASILVDSSLRQASMNISRLVDRFTPNGWMITDHGNLLLWVPPEYHRDVQDDSLFVITSYPLPRPVWLDSSFPHDTHWNDVFAPRI